ncbi:uncharacterized protein METZ01_LOCUS68874 [marine metagenome]|uniref:Uncharacterized protein n=1 Tax=marine metagenome TaxID=408172 RepID=A0A381TIZ5_9ZZZZ
MNTAFSVIIILTQFRVVKGNVHFGRILAMPFLSVCFIKIIIFFAQLAISSPPPIPGFLPPGTCQLAKSPVDETWNAPKNETSTLPRLTYPNDSAESTNDPPGITLT